MGWPTEARASLYSHVYHHWLWVEYFRNYLKLMPMFCLLQLINLQLFTLDTAILKTLRPHLHFQGFFEIIISMLPLDLWLHTSLNSCSCRFLPKFWSVTLKLKGIDVTLFPNRQRATWTLFERANEKMENSLWFSLICRSETTPKTVISLSPLIVRILVIDSDDAVHTRVTKRASVSTTPVNSKKGGKNWLLLTSRYRIRFRIPAY